MTSPILLISLTILSVHFGYSQILSGPQHPGHIDPRDSRLYNWHDPHNTTYYRGQNMKCITHSEEDRKECEEDWFDRLKDDLNDRKECCAFVKYRDCIKSAYDDEDSCTEEDKEVNYEIWRNATDLKYPHLARRCWDDAVDSVECMFLNNMGLWITLLLFLILFMMAFCGAFFYLLLFRGNFL